MSVEDNNEVPRHIAEAPKLTTWKNEPSIRMLQDDLEASRSAHDNYVSKIRKWRDLNGVEGAAKPKKVKGRSQVQPKLIRRQAEWRYSALTEPFLSSHKLFEVKPTTWEDGPAAQQNDLVLNYQFRNRINRVSFIDQYVRANVDEGTAIVRIGWVRETKTEKERVPVWAYTQITDPMQQEQLQQALALKQDNPRGYDEQVPEELKAAVDFFLETQIPSVAVKIDEQEVEVEKIVDNRPVLHVENPENVYWDPSCGNDFNKAGFIVVSFETCQADLRKEPDRYKNLDYVNWEGASTAYDAYHAAQSTDLNFNYSDPLRKRIVAFEYWGYWDIHGDGVLVPIVATWVGDTLIRLEENPFPDKKPPFVLVPYMPVKRQLMGEPDAELLEDNQAILGAIVRGMIDLMARSANSQQGMAKGLLDPVNKRRFENGLDYEFNPNNHPNNGIIQHAYPEIPRSAMEMIHLQNMEAESLTGVKAFSGGLSGEAYGTVATGIRGVLDAASKREMAILRRLAHGLVEIGKKIIAMNQLFLSEEEVIRITNDELVTVKREDLAGNFDLEVDISTAEVDNAKAQELAFMLQTMGNNLEFGMVKLILIEICRLKRMVELAKLIERYEPQPDPLTEQLKQAEVMKAMKEIEKLDSEIALNKARAMKEMAQADQQALDTIEQETGTKHARDLQKQTAQSTGNQNYEITKALLQPRKPEETKPDVEAAIGFNELSRQANDPSSQINNLRNQGPLTGLPPNFYQNA